MSLPKKGIRKINVDGIEYYYTVKLDYYNMTIQTAVGLVDKPNKRFYFSAKQGDPNIVTEKSEKYNPGTITPSIISQAIKYATNQTDWNTSDATVHLFFAENSFSQKS